VRHTCRKTLTVLTAGGIELSPSKINAWFLGGLAVLVVAAVIVMWWVTVQGVGIDTDSITYVDAAMAMRQGQGFAPYGERITHYPPLYPAVLAIAGYVESDLWKAARGLHIAVFATNVALIGALGRMATGSAVAGVMAGLVCFFAPVVYVHSIAWSEPLFITLTTLGTILLSRYFVDGRPSSLYGASVGFGLAALTRYVGLVFIPVAVGCTVTLGSRPVKRRLIDAAGLALVAGLPLSGWVLFNLVTANSATNRQLRLHTVSPIGIVSNLTGGLHRFWFVLDVPAYVKALEFGAILGLTAVVVVMASPRRLWVAAPLSMRTTVLCGLLAVSYMAFVIVSRLLFDAVVPLNTRILAPWLMLTSLLLLAVAWSAKHIASTRAPWYAFILLCSWVWVVNAAAAVSSYRKSAQDGIEFASRAWRASPAMAYIRSAPTNWTVYSNGADFVRLHTGRDARALPERWSPHTEDRNQTYDKEIHRVRAEIDAGTAIVVYFNDIDFRPHLARFEDVDRPVSKSFSEAVIVAPR
jgi:hypothetical protein